MKKINLLLYTIFFSMMCQGQINLVGHTKINNSPLQAVNITVTSEGVITKTLNTRTSSSFKLQLAQGKSYDVYFQNSESPVMYMRINANTVVSGKHKNTVGYELDIPFVYKTDDDIDTLLFKEPFCQLIFNETGELVGDSIYNTAFAGKLIKKTARYAHPASGRDSVNTTGNIIAGKVLMNGNPQLVIKNTAISIIDKKGAVIKSSYTNRFGAFCFTGLTLTEVSRLVVKPEDILSENTTLHLVDSKNNNVTDAKVKNALYIWDLTEAAITKLVDNNYTTNIGGKLVYSSSKEKKFYAKKDVYLINKRHTVIKKTTTNLFGTFVFEDIKPDNYYFISIDGVKPASGVRIDLLSKDDNFVGTLDSAVAGKQSFKITSTYNKAFNEISVDEDEMKMDINATIYGDNTNTPIGKLKILLLNDSYEVIDSAITDNFGTFKFKYLPFLKRFYLSAENTDNILDVFKNIIIYSNDDNLIKIMTHQKGSRFTYNPVSVEISGLRDLELEDPWLEFVDINKPAAPKKRSITDPKKAIIENILFETGKYDITPQATEILDKIILVLNTNKKLKIEVGAHTDSKGSDSSNMKLSQQRAKTVQDYIEKSGIDAKRIISKGYGETKLLNNCSDDITCSELEHAQNRRIEFKILGE